jgi:hypothetical protein
MLFHLIRDWGPSSRRRRGHPRVGVPFWAGGAFPSRPTLGLAKPTLVGDQLGMAQGFGLAAHPPLLRRSPLREWLCPSARAAKLGAGRWRGSAPKGKQSVPSSSASGTRKRSPSQLIERKSFLPMQHNRHRRHPISIAEFRRGATP